LYQCSKEQEGLLRGDCFNLSISPGSYSNFEPAPSLEEGG